MCREIALGFLSGIAVPVSALCLGYVFAASAQIVLTLRGLRRCS